EREHILHVEQKRVRQASVIAVAAEDAAEHVDPGARRGALAGRVGPRRIVHGRGHEDRAREAGDRPQHADAAAQQPAAAGQAAAHSAQPMQRSMPLAKRFSWWRPRKRSRTGRLTSGYSTVTGFLNKYFRVVRRPLKSSPSIASSCYEEAGFLTSVTPSRR